VLAPGETATFTVQPNAGLAEGIYNETIQITGNDDASANVTAYFEVLPAPIINAATPVINTHPASANVTQGDPGDTHTLNVAATSPDGGTLSYQWFSNTSNSNTGGTAITGATGASYAAPIDVVGTFYYYVVVTNTITDNGDGGIKSANLSSNVATLVVTEPSGILTITATAGAGGKITPAGVIRVTYGSAQAFIFTPNAGFKIEKVLVNGVEQPMAVISGTYTFSNINTSHTIHVTFVSVAITITATTGPNGKITPAGVITLKEGASQTFIFTPNSGYKVESVRVNDALVTPVPTMYTFSKVTSSQTIHVTFSSKTPTPTVSIKDNETDNVIVYSYLNTVFIKVETKEAISSTVEIYDMTGRKIHTAPITEAETAITLNVATGIYTVKVISQSETIRVRKVSIMR
jgi:hypothetical protein